MADEGNINTKVVKISEISEIAAPAARFIFLGVDETNSTPINKTISYQTISNDIAGKAFISAYNNYCSKILEASAFLSNEINVLRYDIVLNQYRELTNDLDKKALKTDLFALSGDIGQISNGISTNVNLSIANLREADSNIIQQLFDVSTLLSSSADSLSTNIINTLSIIPTGSKAGMVKTRANSTEPDDEGYNWYGLQIDSNGAGYIRILSSDGAGGSGGTPNDYEAVREAAYNGLCGLNILTTDSVIPSISNTYSWYYISSDSSGEKSENVALQCVKQEIVNSILNRKTIEKDLDGALTAIDDIKTNLGSGKAKFIPDSVKLYNKVIVSSDIETIIGSYLTVVDTSDIGAAPVSYLESNYSSNSAGTHVILTKLNKIYYKKIKSIDEDNETFTYEWIEYSDTDAASTLFYNKLASDSRYVLTSDIATKDKAGIIKIGYTTDETARNFAVKLEDTTNRAYVTVPANSYTLPAAEADTLGGIKIGYSTSGRNFAVNIDATTKRAYVTVPETTTMTDDMLKQVYPIGSVYTTTMTTCPFTFGSWSDIIDSTKQPYITTEDIHMFKRIA